MEEHTKFLYAKIFQAFEKRGEEFLCIFFLAVMVTCVFAQVIARYLFSTAITWSEELAGFCMAWAVYMGGSLGVRERFHIRIAMGVAALPRKIAVSLIVLGDLFWMAFNVAMIFLGTEYLLLLWRRTYIAPSLGIEQKWPQMIVALGYILMSLRLIQVYVRWLKGSRKGLPGISQEQ
jgi:TRAP-type C4-dicarboxylate transport system permease small subunit